MISDIYLKELIKERTDIVEYAVDNYDVLKNNSDNRNVKKYSVCNGSWNHPHTLCITVNDDTNTVSFSY